MTILVDQLTVVYHAGSPLERVALRGVSLHVPEGACAAIVGMTGSGKSTLAQTLNGLITPSAGRVVVDELEVTASGLRGAELRELRRRVGLLFQFPEGQLFAPSIREDVAFGPQRLKLKRGETLERVRWALRAVALPDDDAFLERSPFALSGGQRRRVALAGVLAMRPRTLVLDEPSAGLDAEAREEIYATLRELRRQEGLTLIIISHDMSEVAALADTVLALAGGEARLSGRPDDVFRQPEILAECGLLPPPLAQVAELGRARGLLSHGEVALTPDALAEALAAGGAGRREGWQADDVPRVVREAGVVRGDERYAG